MVAEYVSLAGTDSNCAGGVTPWGTWLTCEETEDRTGDGGLTKDHGFVFEVDPVNVANNENPTPLEGLGRFAHEAVVDRPQHRDRVPHRGRQRAERPALPGDADDAARRLRLAARRRDARGTRRPRRRQLRPDLSAVTRSAPCSTTEWAAIIDPLAEEVSTRSQLNRVTRSRKFEGAWWGDDAAYIVTSYARLDDGSVAEHDGQVWRLDPAANTMELVVRFERQPRPGERQLRRTRQHHRRRREAG